MLLMKRMNSRISIVTQSDGIIKKKNPFRILWVSEWPLHWGPKAGKKKLHPVFALLYPPTFFINISLLSIIKHSLCVLHAPCAHFNTNCCMPQVVCGPAGWCALRDASVAGNARLRWVHCPPSALKSIRVFCSITNPQKSFSERLWRLTSVSWSLGFFFD